MKNVPAVLFPHSTPKSLLKTDIHIHRIYYEKWDLSSDGMYVILSYETDRYWWEVEPKWWQVRRNYCLFISPYWLVLVYCVWGTDLNLMTCIWHYNRIRKLTYMFVHNKLIKFYVRCLLFLFPPNNIEDIFKQFCTENLICFIKV